MPPFKFSPPPPSLLLSLPIQSTPSSSSSTPSKLFMLYPRAFWSQVQSFPTVLSASRECKAKDHTIPSSPAPVKRVRQLRHPSSFRLTGKQLLDPGTPRCDLGQFVPSFTFSLPGAPSSLTPTCCRCPSAQGPRATELSPLLMALLLKDQCVFLSFHFSLHV